MYSPGPLIRADPPSRRTGRLRRWSSPVGSIPSRFQEATALHAFMISPGASWRLAAVGCPRMRGEWASGLQSRMWSGRHGINSCMFFRGPLRSIGARTSGSPLPGAVAAPRSTLLWRVARRVVEYPLLRVS